MHSQVHSQVHSKVHSQVRSQVRSQVGSQVRRCQVRSLLQKVHRIGASGELAADGCRLRWYYRRIRHPQSRLVVTSFSTIGAVFGEMQSNRERAILSERFWCFRGDVRVFAELLTMRRSGPMQVADAICTQLAKMTPEDRKARVAAVHFSINRNIFSPPIH